MHLQREMYMCVSVCVCEYHEHPNKYPSYTEKLFQLRHNAGIVMVLVVRCAGLFYILP